MASNENKKFGKMWLILLFVIASAGVCIFGLTQIGKEGMEIMAPSAILVGAVGCFFSIRAAIKLHNE